MGDETVLAQCSQLIESCKTLMLATASDDGSHSSYAPFIFSDQKFYILLSGLAEHTANVIKARNTIGCMLIVDEADSEQIFARKRLMFKATSTQIDRVSESYSLVMGKFNARFGEIIDLLDSLPDFILFELTPEQAVLVKGFGDAHQIPDHQFANI